MRSILLDSLYLLLLVFVSPLLLFKSLRHGKYRQGWRAKFLGEVPRRLGDRYCIWWHAVSVGEVNLLGTLIAETARQRPDFECVISTTTATGYALARKKYPEHTVFYCPLDFSWAVRNAMKRIRPDVLALVELELWPNLIRAAKNRGGRVAVVNGRLSQHSYRGYRRLRRFWKTVLCEVDLIAAQNDEYGDRFLDLGAPKSQMYVTGSTKFDGAETDRANPGTLALAKLVKIEPDDVVFLAGSTQEGEEEIALEVFQALAPKQPKLRLILVPRHPERFNQVANLLDKTGVDWCRRSKLPADGSATPRVLLVDAVGELGSWWGTAQIAFVGGSLGSRGGQNMIEPAGYGAAVSFGPNTRNFRDIVETLLAQDAAIVVHNRDELQAFVNHAIDSPEWAATLGDRARELVRQQTGATKRTVDLITRLSKHQLHDRYAA